jgi:sterol desaturase/sphingolipid hydroxylase (fatty acid hydroxylase superfamily)
MNDQNSVDTILGWFRNITLVLVLVIGSRFLAAISWVPNVPLMMLVLVVGAIVPALVFLAIPLVLGIAFGWMCQVCKMSIRLIHG